MSEAMNAQDITIRIPAGVSAESAEALFDTVCRVVTEHASTLPVRLTVSMTRYASDPSGPMMFLTPNPSGELTEAEIRAALEPLLPEGLHLTTFPSRVVNIDRREGGLQRSDVDATRAAFAQLGWTELEAWLAKQGVSWLSDGVSAGVSFRIERTS